MDQNFLSESEHLKQTEDKITKLISEEEEYFKKLQVMYKSDPRLLQNLMSASAIKLRNLSSSETKPYFARIDFKDYTDRKDIIAYIGKVGILSENSEMIVTDWRAPISTLYYDSNLGKVNYESPNGKIFGDLNLKRQIITENGKLVSIFDVDSVSDDELLKPYLGANADNRLKNIVASIQSEQNHIIRTNINNDIIVQGVAGSGKTTVALHRIAYLVYNYKDKARPDQFMVVGPNKFFINYISTVLPDLDVGNAKQCTYEDLAKEYINEKFEIQDPTQKLVEYISGMSPNKYLKFKTSMKYKEAIDKFISEFEESLIPITSFYINDYEVLSRDEIIKAYKSYSNIPDINSKVDMTVKSLSNRIKTDIVKYSNAKEYYESRPNSSNDKEILNLKWDTLNKLEKGCLKELKSHLTLNNIKVLQLYKTFIQNIDKYVKDEQIDTYDMGIKTIQNISNKKLDFEDVPALIYLKILLDGVGEYKKYIHTVIDESQDFGTFNFYVLKRLLVSSTFTIFGDITQGIYSYRGISDWHDVKNDVFDGECKIERLEKSYRTTIEIMLAANHISKHLGLGEGKPVIRHGKKVNVVKTSDEEKIKYVYNKILGCKNTEYKSIAIICKSQKDSKYVHQEIVKMGIDAELMADDNETYNGGICVVTSYLAKGLEFDFVIILDADESKYSSDSELDMKLMYVAMTRALHELEILYTSKITKPLEIL